MRNLIRGSVALAAAALCTALPAEAQSWRTMTSARQLWDREAVDAEIQYGAGTLKISPAEAGFLYQMEIRYQEGMLTPLAEYDADDHELRLGAESMEFNKRGGQFKDGSSATIRLSREVPLDLELEFGAGEAEIELGGTSLQRLSLSTGASQTSVAFSSPNRIEAELIEIQAGAADLRVTGLGNTRAQRVDFEGGIGATVLDFTGAAANMTASVEMGVGAVTLRLPRSHNVQISRSAFLTSFEAPQMTRQGDRYVGGNSDRGAPRLSIDVRAALGSVEIEWVD